MRLHRKKRTPAAGEAEAAISQAVTAGAEASERLASASDVHAEATRQAASETGIISELRAMRQQNHLAEMIVESVRRGPA